MKRQRFVWGMILGATAFLLGSGAWADRPMEIVAGEILLKFKEGTSQEAKTALEKEFELVLLRESQATGVCLYRSKQDNVLPLVAAIKNHVAIEFVEPNSIQKKRSVPNDPYYSSQWYLGNIKMPDAWGVFTGTAIVKVAVIDGGVSKYHNEISSILISQGEWDYVDGDADANDEDDSGHGTLIAGIIAALRNNGAGISGICERIRILPIRTADSDGYSNIADTASAIERAVDQGSKVINCSFGGPTLSSAESSAITYANSRGVLVVCAAGNESENNDAVPSYPANHTQANVISVANTTSDDRLAASSNYGANTVDVGAPGSDIFSTQARKQIAQWESEQDWDDWEQSVVSGLGYYWDSSYQGLFTETSARTEFYPSDSSLFLFSPLVDCSDYEKIKIKIYFGGSLASGDMISLYATDADCTEIHDLSSIASEDDLGKEEGWTYRASSLGKKSGRVAIYFESDALINGFFGLYYAEVLGGTTNRATTSRLFERVSGTSFSAPVVAGVAAMLMSQNPSLTHLQVKDIILQTARKVSFLNGKVVSGGIIDAAAALREAKARMGVAPVITSSRTASATVGTAFSYTIRATNTNPSTKYNATGRPAWMSVNTNTGLISGTPTAAGIHAIIISASNAAGSGSATLTVTIGKATPVITNRPTASAITFGQGLSNSVLSGGSNSLAGTWSWVTPSNRPNAGTALQSVRFTPTASGNYNTITTNVSLVVKKATPVITWNPAPITVGSVLSSAQLNATSSVAGLFMYGPGIGTLIPKVGATNLRAVFTTTNFNFVSPVTNTVSLVVNKANPVITRAPTSSVITLGESLASSTLINGLANVAGTFGWVSPTNKPAGGASLQPARFTPTASNNYNSVVTNISVWVRQK